MDTGSKESNTSAVVTGGAGAIGSRLVRRLLAEGIAPIHVIDDLSSGFEWLLPADSRITLHKWDVCNLLDSGLNVPGAPVFHLAAFFANQNSIDHPRDDLHTNGMGTLTTLMWAENNAAPSLVYASAGCSIAGHGIETAIREDMPVSLNLDTPYQITKALGEYYCNYFLEKVPTVRCRFFNSFGPGEVPGTYRNVIPNFIWQALQGNPLRITGTGDETRDFIYVDDLVDGLWRSSHNPKASGQAINLGTGVQTRIGDLAEWVISLCNSGSRVEYAPRRPWDKSAHREADIGRARDLLDFKPAMSVREGLGRTIEWFYQNRRAIEASLDNSKAR